MLELPPIHTLDTYIPATVTRIYDVRGELVSELFVERRSLVPLTEMPLALRQATLAIEDDRFYQHAGIDIKGITRAFLANLKAGRVRQGGSTITQQLAKNVFLTQEHTLTRKVKELMLTLQMERQFSKDEILQLYLNQIYFGHGSYGVAAAAKTYFGKTVSELTLEECALLAGLPKGPQYYSPLRRPDRALNRRNIVLNRMAELGFITPGEARTAKSLPLRLTQGPHTSSLASYAVEMVRLALEPTYGTSALYKGGLSIYTTLDVRLQRAAEATAEKHLAAFDENFGEERLKTLVKGKKLSPEKLKEWLAWKNNKDPNKEPWDQPEPAPVQGALVSLDPNSGGIRALVGGRDFQTSQFNRAVQARRQPGSTFKPFVWLAALESGLTAATVVNDYPLAFADVVSHPRLIAETTDYAMLQEIIKPFIPEDLPPDAPNPVWAPQNWDGKFLGPITLRKGIALSRNLVSVRLIDRVGPEKVVEEAHRLGVQSPLEAVLSLGLGSSVVTLQEMTSAFGTFANQGVAMQPYLISRVVDRHGRVLEEHGPQGREVLPPQSNYLMIRLLKAVVQEGTAKGAAVIGPTAAGKTGTTQDQRDLWFIGFVPDLVTGVWIGQDDFEPLGKHIASSGTTVPWWTEYMLEAQKYLSKGDWPVPPRISFAKIDRDSGLLALPSCPQVVLEAFREGQAPKTFCAVDHEASGEKQEVEITE